jgi:hypothetical protein
LPPFIIDVYDEDPPTLIETKPSADFLNRAVISHKKIKYSTDNEILTPEWHELRLTKSAPKSGEILISFAICGNDWAFKRPVN